MPTFVVYIFAPPYPFQGYELGVKTYPKDADWATFVDTMPSTLVDHVIVNADGKLKAKAIGFRLMFKRARAENV